VPITKFHNFSYTNRSNVRCCGKSRRIEAYPNKRLT
jgi:hypothetical protein